VLEDLHHDGFDRDPAVLAALAANVDDGTVVAAAKVTDVGAQQVVGAQSGKQCGEDEGAVAFDPVAASLRRCGCGSAFRVARSAATDPVGSAFGSVLGSLGQPTNGIGLAAISSEVYRKVHRTFQVDQHR
jgi:hypothetical protein